MGELDIRPDPRISNLRPGWLADDDAWRSQLQAMTREDCRWVERHWGMCDGDPPRLDTSWIRYEIAGGWGIWPLVMGVALVATIVVFAISALGGFS